MFDVGGTVAATFGNVQLSGDVVNGGTFAAPVLAFENKINTAGYTINHVPAARM